MPYWPALSLRRIIIESDNRVRFTEDRIASNPAVDPKVVKEAERTRQELEGRRFLTLVLPLHRLGVLLHFAPWLMVQFLGTTSPIPSCVTTQHAVAETGMMFAPGIARGKFEEVCYAMRVLRGDSARCGFPDDL